MGEKIKVLVVDDSAYNRKALTEMLEASVHVTVVGSAADGEDALKKVPKLNPDVVTLDLEMPRMDGFTFLRLMMENFPTPTIVISSRDEDKSVFKALELGAFDFIAKPTHRISTQLKRISQELLTKVMAAGSVNLKVVKGGAARKGRTEMRPAPKPLTKKAHARPLPGEARRSPTPGTTIKATKGTPTVARAGFPIVVIGASTGGPPALQILFSNIPEDTPAAFIVGQHMPRGFTKSFAERLNKTSILKVLEAEAGSRPAPGTVLIAPGGEHMTFRREGAITRCVLSSETASDKYVPSIDRLFVSASETFGKRLIGVIMTGMGDDGKKGIRSVKENKGRTIAQDEKSSVIFGMPREAIATGTVDTILPLDFISGKIATLCMEDLPGPEKTTGKTTGKSPGKSPEKSGGKSDDKKG